MKIVFDLTSLYDHISGIERYAMEISRHMILACPSNHYILLFKNEVHSSFSDSEIVRKENVECKILKGKNKLLFNQITLLRALKKIKANAYIFLAFPAPILFNKKNQYVAVHDMSPFEMGEDMKKTSRIYFQKSQKKAFKRARRIITISKYSAERIVKLSGIKPGRIWLIYCGVTKNSDASSIDALKKYKLPKEYILSLSTLEPRKNLKLLIEAYDKLLCNNKDIPKLVLAGRSGWKLEDVFGDKYDRVKSHIILPGFIDEKDLPVVYKNATFFVFPSKYEGFGMPPLEAMNMGVPVLSSDATSMPEILKDGAMYFESDNCESLTDGLEKMLSLSDIKKSKMIERGLEIADLYSWEEEAKKLEKKLAMQNVRARL